MKHCRARLEGIQKAAAANRQKTEQLRYHADAVRRGHGVWDETKAKELAEREAAAREVSDQLQLLSRDLEEHPTFHPLARPARQIAEVESQAARGSLEAARRAGDPAKRQAELEQAGVRLAAVTWKVDELKRKFDELARLDDDRRRLSVLAAARGRPGHPCRPGRRRLATAPALEALADEQDRLRRELDEVLKNSPALRAEALAAQAREADALAARARALAEQQREEARRTADDGPRSAAIKALAAKQRRPGRRRPPPRPPRSTSRWRKTVAVVSTSTPWPAPATRSSAATSIKPATAPMKPRTRSTAWPATWKTSATTPRPSPAGWRSGKRP